MRLLTAGSLVRVQQGEPFDEGTTFCSSFFVYLVIRKLRCDKKEAFDEKTLGRFFYTIEEDEAAIRSNYPALFLFVNTII